MDALRSNAGYAGLTSSTQFPAAIGMVEYFAMPMVLVD
jgi:hypothetical protein